MEKQRWTRGDLRTDESRIAAARAIAAASVYDPTRGENEQSFLASNLEVATSLVAAVTERRGVVLWHDYEECTWGYPDAVGVHSVGKHWDGCVGVWWAPRSGETRHEHYALDLAFVEIIDAPLDAQIDRWRPDDS